MMNELNNCNYIYLYINRCKQISLVKKGKKIKINSYEIIINYNL